MPAAVLNCHSMRDRLPHLVTARQVYVMQIVEKPVQHHVQRQRLHAVYGAQSSDEVMPVAATDFAAKYAVCCRTTFRGLFQKTPVVENNVASGFSGPML